MRPQQILKGGANRFALLERMIPYIGGGDEEDKRIVPPGRIFFYRIGESGAHQKVS